MASPRTPRWSNPTLGEVIPLFDPNVNKCSIRRSEGPPGPLLSARGPLQQPRPSSTSMKLSIANDAIGICTAVDFRDHVQMNLWMLGTASKLVTCTLSCQRQTQPIGGGKSVALSFGVGGSLQSHRHLMLCTLGRWIDTTIRSFWAPRLVDNASRELLLACWTLSR